MGREAWSSYEAAALPAIDEIRCLRSRNGPQGMRYSRRSAISSARAPARCSRREGQANVGVHHAPGLVWLGRARPGNGEVRLADPEHVPAAGAKRLSVERVAAVEHDSTTDAPRESAPVQVAVHGPFGGVDDQVRALERLLRAAHALQAVEGGMACGSDRIVCA